MQSKKSVVIDQWKLWGEDKIPEIFEGRTEQLRLMTYK